MVVSRKKRYSPVRECIKASLKRLIICIETWNTVHTFEFTEIELFKNAEIRSVEDAEQNAPQSLLGVWIEQRLHCDAVGEQKHDGNHTEVHQFLQLLQTIENNAETRSSCRISQINCLCHWNIKSKPQKPNERRIPCAKSWWFWDQQDGEGDITARFVDRTWQGPRRRRFLPIGSRARRLT